ncbi:MAG: RNA polymerase sigma factor [Verrucomicrobiae bacterium]|nr:RNA polymerase sigma factor [Verrucomicrobiae bacterium]
MAEEAQLVQRCLQGDSRAWDELFTRHYDATSRFIFKLSHDLTREDVEEICQEVFLSVVRHLAEFNGRSQLQTWIFRIAVNKTRDFVDKRQTAKRGGGVAPLSLQEPDPETGLTLDLPAPTPGPDGSLMAAEDASLVVQALHQLEDPCREIIELRYFADLSYEEIAAALRLNPKTVSSRLSKCLDKLAAVARKLFPQHSPRNPVQSTERER